MKNKNTLMIVVGIILVIAIVGGIFVLKSRQAQKKTGAESLPAEAIIPTIDSSVLVDLKAAKKKGEVVLSIKNAPNGSKSADYVLTYDAREQGEQGAIGKCEFTGSLDCEKQVTLGTCSSGTCIYHDVVGKIKLEVKFSGNYGERIFEKEYAL